MLVHILSALHPQSGVPIRQLLRKVQSSPGFKSQGARIIIMIIILRRGNQKLAILNLA
jgi:hypothetical protein